MKLCKLLTFIAFLVHTVSCQKEGSLTFVIDNTNSMGTDIKYVRGGVDKIMDVILQKKSSQIEDIILVRFNDPDAEKLITTRDRYDLKEVLKDLRTWSDYRYNKECPEMALKGVKIGLESSKDNSHMFVFTDASPKDFELTKDVIRLAQKKSSQIVFILTEGNHCRERSEMFNPYYEIAKATFGQVLRIKAKTEIGKVIDYIAETCSGERTVLVQIDIPERENRRVSFDIDDQTEYVIISASGKNVILDWSEMFRNFNVKVNKITWLNHFKAAKVIVPEPGRYSVTVWGKSETSVFVYGRTNFKFHYGFSLSPVQSLMDTVKNPTAGEKHQLAISVSDPDQAVLVDAVELLDMNENVLKNLSLNRESTDFYTTKLFLPPISTFLIAVLGEGKYTHKPVRRISKTPIEPKMQDFEPIITVDQIKDTYEYNSNLSLNCNVKGYPGPYIAWTDENSTVLSNTTLNRNPPYDYSYHLIVEKLKKSQRYTCYAENKFGKRSKNVFVNVNSPFIVKKHLEDVTIVSFEKEIELICDIKSKLPMKISWWKNGKLVTSHISNDRTKLIIDKANIQDQDTYICQAELLEDGLTRAYQTKLKIKGLKPIVTVEQIKKTYEYNSTLYLNCNVKGYPKPQTIWTDENGTILRNMIFKKNTLYDYSYHKTVEKLKKSQRYTCYAENKFGKNSTNVFVNVDSPFIITKHLDNVTNVAYEKKIELICDIKSKWPMKITWWKDGKLVTSHVSNDGTKLMIDEANIQDQDTYICKAELLEDGLTRAYQTKLKIKGLKPIVTVEQIKKTYEYNSTLYLNCNVKGYPKPQTIWTDENGTILRNMIFKKNTLYDYSYHKTVEKLKKSQRYTCYAENKFGKNSTNVFVNVDSPFIITKHLDNVTNVAYEKKIELICDIKSKWPMKITWWKDGKLVTSHVSNDGTKLMIDEANIQDQDTYICKAELLEDGLTRAYQTKLKIKGLKPIVTVEQIKKTYEYNSTLYLNCNVKGYPKPQTIWTDENGTILRNMIFKKNTLYDYSYHKTVEKLKKSQRYTCYAENKFGKNSTNVFVNVDSPFIITKHLDNVTNVAYEKKIELICDIKSKWPMKITWWKDGKLVTSHVSNDGTKLMIKKAEIYDQGIYMCKAKLLEDDLSLTYQTKLKISGLILPHIEKQTAFLIIKKAEPVTLTCKITKGFPAPKRVWEFKEIGSDKWIALKNSEEHLTIERSQLMSGNYKCLASNVIGYDEMDIKLAVEVPPEIIPSERTVYALELDLVLRIPCETVGYPKPTVTWRINGSIIEMGKRYKLDKNTLVILNPVTNDSGNYTCEVQNRFGKDSRITEAIVKSNDILIITDPNIEETTTSNPIPQHNIERKDENTKYILEGSIISLACPHAKGDAVRWYKDYQYLNITGSPLVIKKGETKDDGIYNCRVCNYNGTQSFSYKINVGYEPRGNSEPVIINKYGSLDQTLSKSLECKFDVKPMTNEIEWTFNGEMINENTTDFNGEINWGIYTCSITNPHGTAKKTFTVISNDCLIKKTLITKNAPLILTEDSSWPDIYYNENYLRLPRNMNSKLFCRSQKENNIHFEKFSKNNEILATCNGENKFSVNGTIVKFEDLQCNLPIQHIINETGATCFNENTELVKVGFEVDKFVEIYEVCVDKTKMVPLYTRIDLTPLYNVKITPYETARVDEINGDKCGEGSKCCFGKTQLVGERDVRYGPSQAATLIDMNSVPYWRPCDEKLGWNDIVDNITRKLEQNQGQFVIWSGASNYTTKSDVTVPRYLWKVINDVDSEYSLSIVYVNDPTPTVEDKLCEDICSQFDWITSSESTYCCQLEEFRKAFDIPKTFQ